MFNNIGFPTFLFLFIIFCAWLRYEMHKDSKKMTGQQSFLAREKEANLAPVKSLKDLDYISIPLETFPFGVLTGHKEIEHMEYTIRNLAKDTRKIVNLTGITNTDLKLMYGAANIVKLMEYDASYITLIKTLQEWADVLYAEGLYSEVVYYRQCPRRGYGNGTPHHSAPPRALGRHGLSRRFGRGYRQVCEIRLCLRRF